MDQVRDLNDILSFAPTKRIIFTDVGSIISSPRFSMNKYMFRPAYDEKVKKAEEIRQLADLAWEQGEKSRSTELHAEASMLIESIRDE